MFDIGGLFLLVKNKNMMLFFKVICFVELFMIRLGCYLNIWILWNIIFNEIEMKCFE